MKNGRKNRFWLVLALTNLFSVTYAIILFRRAETADAHLLAALALIGCVFLLALIDLLAVIDAVAIVLCKDLDELTGRKRQNRRSHPGRSHANP